MILWILVAMAAIAAVAIGYKIRRERERSRRRLARKERRVAEREAWETRDFKLPDDADAGGEDLI